MTAPTLTGALELHHVCAGYGKVAVLHDIDLLVPDHGILALLGPNGAGKSTTMRCILGLDRPTTGTIRVNGRSYRDSPAPMHEVGALLEARAIHGGRSAYSHLLALGATHGIGRRRVNEVLDQVGLTDVAGRRAGTFSLGMGQRLGIATALLGDPQTLLLDEPVNGLDPEGIRWVRGLLRHLAAEGRTVFVSSHLMSEMALTAEHLVVVGRGRLIADTSTAEFTRQASSAVVRVVSPQAERLAALLSGEGRAVATDDDGALAVTGATTAQIGDLALANGVAIHELTPAPASLEEAFMSMTADSLDFPAHVGPPS
jgi:ABC-2 type transport system ATP-binding protein